MDTPAMSMALTDRVKGQWATVMTRWDGLPGILQAILDEVGARVRRALALPSHEELATLSTRLDLLDARIREISQLRGASAVAATVAVVAELAPMAATARKVRAVVANKRSARPVTKPAAKPTKG